MAVQHFIGCGANKVPNSEKPGLAAKNGEPSERSNPKTIQEEGITYSSLWKQKGFPIHGFDSRVHPRANTLDFSHHSLFFFLKRGWRLVSFHKKQLLLKLTRGNNATYWITDLSHVKKSKLLQNNLLIWHDFYPLW